MTPTPIIGRPSSEEVTTPVTWSVRCTGKNYSQTIVTEETSAVFRNVDFSQDYSIEVKALGMSVSQGITIPANAAAVSNIP